MDKIFNLESPIMRVLSRITDLVWLNILTMICCIPVVTIGAALTAQHYVVLKMVRDEEGYVAQSFFKSFKSNLKQATCIWLIFLVFIAMFAVDIYIFLYSGMEFPKPMVVIVCAFAVVVLMVGTYVFPVLSKFDNTVKNTILNAFKIAIVNLPKTVVMMILCVTPAIMLMFSLRTVPIVFLLGFSGIAYLCAMIYSGIFKKFEPEEEEENFTVELTEKAEELDAGLTEDKEKQQNVSYAFFFVSFRALYYRQAPTSAKNRREKDRAAYEKDARHFPSDSIQPIPALGAFHDKSRAYPARAEAPRRRLKQRAFGLRHDSRNGLPSYSLSLRFMRHVLVAHRARAIRACSEVREHKGEPHKIHSQAVA